MKINMKGIFEQSDTFNIIQPLFLDTDLLFDIDKFIFIDYIIYNNNI
ncbi:MAG: hypothetical protein UT39_C0016G0021 [Candidatus Woesebacteria bacterium GW2011_GWA1_39_21]|uniref:Uncharacterized protein n=1 Tax=Candidatus Woesebacteria bacterium GW2011_GWA1_39_21 TaxID=1618550 RepID=A0A0G0ND50_9BACT|nr:MAG: hypothetical protein UT39_C0016G0021 [Candidatus Woesebacteria bacterium GW2011_GWA1_39_21]